MENDKLPNPMLHKYLTPEKLKEDYLKYGSISRLARRYGVTLKSLFDALDNYGLSLKELDNEIELSVILNEYKNVLEKLGHHPVSAEMQQYLRWKELGLKITRRYGSMTNFRKIHGYQDNTTTLRSQRTAMVYKDYVSLGTLDKVSKKYNISRERIRQILQRGSSLGLFKYPLKTPKLPPDIMPEQLKKDYLLYGSKKDMARRYGINTKELSKLMTKYGLSYEKLHRERIRLKIFERYKRIMERFDHHPTTTELYQTSMGKALHNNIGRVYGAMDNFRKAYGYPIPEKGGLKFARIRQEKYKISRERILNLLRTKTKADIAEISAILKIGHEVVRRQLVKLRKEGVVDYAVKGRLHYYFIKNQKIIGNEADYLMPETAKPTISPENKAFIDELSKLYIQYGSMDIIAKNMQEDKSSMLETLDEIIKSKAIFPVNTRKALILALRIKGFYDKRPSVYKVSKKFGLHEVIINRYLRQGSQAGLFKYPVFSVKRKKYSTAPSLTRQGVYSKKNIHAILAVKKDYDMFGSHEEVAKKRTVSRERIRQILTMGSDLGLFEYPPKKQKLFSSITKEDLYSSLLRHKNIHKLSRLHKVSADEIKKAMEKYGISMEAIQLELCRIKALNIYQDLVRKLGHHPSTTEIKLKHHYLLRRIKGIWGSIYEFRKAYGFPSPKMGPPEKYTNTTQ